MPLDLLVQKFISETEFPFHDHAVPLSYKIVPEETYTAINLSAGFPNKLAAAYLVPLLENKIKTTFPNLNTKINFNQEIRPHKTQLPGMMLKNVKNVIAVGSGKGGVGKSTIALNLAIALSQLGARAGILDADIYGPSLPLMLGKEYEVKIEDNNYLPVLAHGIQAMSIGFLTQDDKALIWRGPMLAKSLLQMLNFTRFENLDYLIIDLPPGTGDIQLSLVQKVPLAGAIIVSTPQQIATQDALKAVAMFNKTNVAILGLIENMSSYHCDNCKSVNNIFGTGGAKALAAKNNLPFLGQIPLQQAIQEGTDKGIPITLANFDTGQNFFNIALHAAINLAKKPLNYADKIPQIRVET